MITVILNSYKRPHSINEQIEYIKNQTVKPESIMIWMNNGGVKYPEINDPNIIISKCSHNMKFHARFAYGLLAKTEYVAFFDDDTLPGEKWFESCIRSIKLKPGIYGTTGVVCTGEKYRPNYKIGWNGRKNEKIEQVHLVGHAWFMKTEWLKYLWYERPHSWENGEDIQLSYFCKKYGGINTYVPPHPENDKQLWGSVLGRKYGGDENATYLTQKNHSSIRDELCRKFIREGWSIQ
jgi:hypothetical protein